MTQIIGFVLISKTLKKRDVIKSGSSEAKDWTYGYQHWPGCWIGIVLQRQDHFSQLTQGDTTTSLAARRREGCFATRMGMPENATRWWSSGIEKPFLRRYI